ncbi:NAD(P)/FAD-dependent oxidoreductase [Colwellia sp. E2M01]|uniref:NAD(P)/FAD-dependent oxidoreductase n=1 Tax=Colwellia sp. E2M01 TaxID=2841561 RepID=UPI001C0A0E54|nr:NAD(P)/FAD-dependent oxidoreductase [Colwellia sp. E2M01]MBU2871625.1 NAD(P)/FAD-dependent oxidoreductase [Colwellia sp. E2M01]
MPVNEKFDVIIIGAGPSGAIAASILVQKGWKVLVIEREQFPRFSIGESLLPQCMAFIEEADMLDVVQSQAEALGFQYKNGAAFYRNGEHSNFDFTKKFSDGAGTTFQVKRANFDKVLADRADEIGADIRYKHTVNAVDFKDDSAVVSVTNEQESLQFEAKFILDASGYGRVLPRLLSLELPSTLSDRRAVFCHFEDGIIDEHYDRDKILITVHPEKNDIWYWLIPFSDGTVSFGVVGDVKYFDSTQTDEAVFDSFLAQEPYLAELLKQAKKITPVRSLQGYSSDVTKLYGDRFALLGNAGEFLDPVFSSGVTIAMYSSSLAANLLDKQLSGDDVSWQTDYADNLKAGVEVFKHFVMSWYDTELQNVIFFQKDDNDVKSMICSILAGYAWDKENPYVSKTERRLNALVDICRQGNDG